MLWKPGDPVGTLDTFVPEAHLAELVLEIACGHDPAPTVYIVAPHVEPHIDFASVAVRADVLEAFCASRPYDRVHVEQQLARLEPANRAVAAAAMQLVCNIRALDTEGSISSARYLANLVSASIGSSWPVPPPVATSVPKLLTFLCELADKGFRELDWPAVDVVSAPSPTDKKWWTKSLSLRRTMERMKNRFDAIVNGAHPAQVVAVRTWIERIRDGLGMLEEKSHSADAEVECFKAASAFFAASCQRRLAMRQPVLALIELHRAWEWLLCSVCASHGSLDFTRTPPQIYYSQTKVGFGALSSEVQRVQPTFLHGVAADLIRLNEIRNVLAYTHQMAAPAEAEVSRLISVLGPALENRTNAAWRTLRTNFMAPLPIDLALLVDPDGTLRSGIRKANNTDLDPATHGL